MGQKSLYRLSKSGYLQIDFAFVILIFFTLFLLVHGIYKQKENSLENAFIINKLNTDARDICLILTSSSGFPSNWEADLNSSYSIGLRTINNFSLSLTKMQFLNDSSNYYELIDYMNFEDNFNVKIVGLNSNNTYINFGSNINDVSVYFSNYVCYSYYDSEIVRVLVEVWK